MHDWTGSEATALRKALRMTEGRFARSVGVSARTVSNLAHHPAMVPRTGAQDMLDELLAGADPAVRARFDQPVSVAGVAGEGVTAQVVSLDVHPHYAADFRALACGQVSAARAALGMSPKEFAAWLGTVLRWMPVQGAVERWERHACPPGDVVMAACASLAGAR